MPHNLEQNQMQKLSVISILLLTFMIAGCPKNPATSTGSYGSGSGTGRTGGSLSESGLAKGERIQERVQGSEDGTGPLADIYFNYDSSDLSEESLAALQANAEWLKNNQDASVEVEGHCDERGTIEYNLALGAKRARAAREYLVALGVEASRLSTISYGEELPKCPDQNESCWQQNRRSHFLILNQ